MKLSLFVLVLFFSFFQVQSSLCVLDCDWSKALSFVETEKPSSPCHQAESNKTSHSKKDTNHCFDMAICSSGHYVSKQSSYDLKSYESKTFHKSIFVKKKLSLSIFIAKTKVIKPTPHWSLRLPLLKHTIKTHSFLI